MMGDEERVGEILRELAERRDAGEPVDIDALIGEHPDLAEDLRKRIAALDALDVASRARELPDGTPAEVGDFRILRELGRGGMGVVYEAEQVSMRRRVALKLLSLAAVGTPHAVQRFRREAQAAGRIHHTNIVPIHAMGQHAGHWYYAMELVEGRPLCEVIAELRRQRSQPTESALARRAAGRSGRAGSTPSGRTGTRAYFVRVAEMFAGVADALHLAHQEGVVHRDIKPSNLLLDADGTLKIVDFGLARVDDEGPSMTMTGDLLGTPAYMSPEQALAKRMPIDFRTDIYSLGATVYEMVALQPPFRGKTLQDICSQIVTKDPAEPRRLNPHVPRDLETIVLKAMEKDRDRRYQSAAELARDLRRFAEGIAVRARRTGPIGKAWRLVKRRRTAAVSAVALLLLAGSAIFFAARSKRETERWTALEYARLCTQAQAELNGLLGIGPHPPTAHAGSAPEARELLDRAIELRPARPEAFWLRALAEGGGLEDRLADVDRARDRGLAERTGALLRALLFANAKRPSEAEAEEARALRIAGEGPAIDKVLEGWLAATRGDMDRAERLFDQTIALSRSDDAVRILAYRPRARVRARRKRYQEALEDLAAVRTLAGPTFDLDVETATVWRRIGDEETAEARFGALLERAREQNRPRAWTRLADACRAYRQADWLERAVAEGCRAFPEHFALLLQAAMAAGARGEHELQRTLAARAVAQRPDHHLAHEVHALALNRLNRQAEALAAIDEAIRLNSGCALAHAKRGGILRALGRHADSLAALDEALLIDPTDAGLHSERAWTLLWSGDQDGALVSFDRAISLDAGCADAHYGRGELLSRAGRWDEAVAAYQSALDADPIHLRALNDLGLAFANLEEWTRAAEAYDRSLRLRPDDALVLDNRARAYAALNQPEKALEHFRRSLDLDASSAGTWCEMGSLLANVWNRDAEAEQAFVEAVSRDETLWRAWLNLHIVRRKQGHLEDAVEPIRRASALMPERLGLRLRLADLLQELQRHENAREAYCGVLERDPRNVRALFGLGIADMEAGRYDDAAESFRAVLAVQEHASSWVNLGICHWRKGEFGDAARCLRKGIALDDASTTGYEWLGSALVETGELEEAVRVCREVQRRRPENVSNLINLALALARLDQAEDALAVCDEADRTDPGREEIRALREALGEARQPPAEPGTGANGG